MAKEPKFIAGIINQYHFNEGARDRGTAISKIQTLYAKRHWLSGLWSVHELTINTGRPVTTSTRLDRNALVHAARVFAPRLFSIANHHRPLSGKIGTHRELESGLTLKQAFNLICAGEENPKQYAFQTSSSETMKSCVEIGILDSNGKAALKQIQPESSFYWRSLNPQEFT
jgi:hypothetical protein